MFIDKISTLYLFWAVSRGLNGGDKFFNVQYMPQTAPWSTKGVVVDANSGEIVYRLHGMETMGLYGVNRDSKTVNYFKQIHLPAGVALVTLYGIAVAEIILGLTFLLIFIKSLLPQHKIQKESLYGTRTLHRLAFKGSAAIFLFFATGDILFGDRTELWEHGTFFVMALLSYYLYIQSDSIETEEEKEISQGEQFN